MTAPTGPLYVRDGSRYVKWRDCPPIPTPKPVADDPDLPPGWSIDPLNPFRTIVPAPRCPHGHFRACRHGCTREDYRP